MSVLSTQFNKDCDQCSPIQVEVARVVNYDEDGNEIVSYEPVDCAKIIASNGSVDDWSLTSLLKAGIDPAFSIHTGLVNRLEGVGVVNDTVAYINEVLAEDNNSKEDSEN